MAELTRAQLIAKAKMAEAIERPEDCATFMTVVVHEHCKESGLQKEERNLLSSAYKDLIGKRRASLRMLAEDMEDDDGTIDDRPLAEAYKKEIQIQLSEKCDKAIELVQKLLEPLGPSSECSNEGAEEHAFYNKMCGDYYRYKAEYLEGEALEGVKKIAGEHYANAKTAADKLDAIHATRLGLALNMSVFMYEIQGTEAAAKALAEAAYNEATEKLKDDDFSEDVRQDAEVVLQLLKDNLDLWSADMKEREEANGGAPGPEVPAEVAQGSPMNAVAALKKEEEPKVEQDEANP